MERYGKKTRRAVAFQFDQQERAVGSDGQQVDTPADAGVFLPQRSPLTNDAVSQTTFHLPFIAAKVLISP